MDYDQYMDLLIGTPGYCHDECVSCANGGVSDCYACGPDAFYGNFTISSTGLYSGNCICPNSMYLDINTYERSCEYCHETCDNPAGCTAAGCNACFGSGPEDCAECKPGREFKQRADGAWVCECKPEYSEHDNGECKLFNFDAECDLTTYDNNGTCERCGTECLKCSQDFCALCIPDNWVVSSDNWNCEPPSCTGNMFWNGYTC